MDPEPAGIEIGVSEHDASDGTLLSRLAAAKSFMTDSDSESSSIVNDWVASAGKPSLPRHY